MGTLGIGVLGVAGLAVVAFFSFFWFFFLAWLLKFLWNLIFSAELTHTVFGADRLTYPKSLGIVGLLLFLNWIFSPKRRR